LRLNVNAVDGIEKMFYTLRHKEITMNIIRTKAVELTSIPAIAYKQKLHSGGAGVKILRLDQDAAAVLTIDRRTGEGVPYGIIIGELFPQKAIKEAFELTVGLPYSARGKIAITAFENKAEVIAEDVEENETAETDMVESDEYKAIVKAYTDFTKDKLDYQRMNKDFIQFANKSTTVGKMVGEKAKVEDILTFVIKSRATFLSGKKESLSDAEVAALIETLDEINLRSAFKELNAHLRKMSSGAKR